MMRGAIAVAACALLVAGVAGAASKRAGLTGNPGQFFGPDEYPAEALRLGQQGRVVAELWIDERGKVASCKVATSSGSPSLDRTTCSIALERVTFQPATDRRGRPIAAKYMLPVRWSLPTGSVNVAASPPPDMSMVLTLSIDSEGHYAGCHADLTPAPPPGADPCMAFPVGRDSEFHWTRDGRPVGGTITRRMSQQIKIDP